MIIFSSGMRNIFFIYFALLLISYDLFAEFKSATIGIDGLTCSMCSNSVEKQLRKLDFVEDIKMNLNTQIAEITFLPGRKVIMKDVVKSVYNAGYSVRFAEAIFKFEDFKVSSGSTFTYNHDSYYFVNTPEKTLDEEAKIKFIGKDFMSKKEFKKWGQIIASTKINKSLCDNTYLVTL